jgi:hypothetical protein
MDLASTALALTRDEFRARYRCFFLCSESSVARAERPQATELWQGEERTGSYQGPLPGRPFIAQVAKVQPQFPSMITVGRTQNNDIVVPDTAISKFHAFFRLDGKIVELADAGSRNGTFVGMQRLAPKQPVRLKAGDHLRFARLAFVLLEPEAAWNWIVRAMDEWG